MLWRCRLSANDPKRTWAGPATSPNGEPRLPPYPEREYALILNRSAQKDDHYAPESLRVIARHRRTPNYPALSAKSNPYPGKLSVVEPGALADLLLVDGNPIENINLVADPGNNFLVIMKDGTIYREYYAQVSPDPGRA